MSFQPFKNNSINNEADGSQHAINNGSGQINQIIQVNNLGIRTELPKDVQARIETLEKGQDIQRVRLSDFVGPETPIISGMEFKNMEILGPCIAFVTGVGGIKLLGCKWLGSEESLFIEIPDSREFVQGVIGIVNCVFVNIAIMARSTEMVKVKRGFTFGN